jgi:hypothetical protein
MQYWKFFPAADDPERWGRVPVWGFATVSESATDDVATGTRLYGYLPMGTELIVEPGRVGVDGFTDVTEHRAAMAGAYNRYVRVDADPIHVPGREAQRMLLWPLFYTSFLIDDFLADHDLVDARTAIISSASSKTAIGTAFLLSRRDGVRVVGMTSSGNVEFVRELGCYRDVVTYDAAASLAREPAVYVDIAGNRDVQAAVHEHLADQLRASLVVGDTHWDHQSYRALPETGPTPQFFFAPAQISKRNQEWGAETLAARVGAAWAEFSSWTDGWLRVERSTGADAVVATYRALLDGTTDPRVGHVCTLASS